MLSRFLNRLRPPGPPKPIGSDDVPPARRHSAHPAPEPRRSNGLKLFFETIPHSDGLQILDLGGLTEGNINFLGSLGGTIHAVDLLGRFDTMKHELADRPLDSHAAHGFVNDFLNFPRKQFDAILAWDTLEFLDTDVLNLAIPRVQDILRPGGGLLTFFHTHGRGETVPVYRYEIEQIDRLRVDPKGTRELPNAFNNRSLERLFQDFSSVKFFLTKNSLREVIVVR